jgi:hypothetical protein
MVTRERKILVVGLPKTGKTTFLAALWDVVSSGEVDGALRLERLSGEKQHLNDIRDLWADCNEIPRTRIPTECLVDMTLSDVASNTRSTVYFTDMAGESFERQWMERVWTSDYDSLVAEASGVLLFIHPANVKEAPLIRDAQSLIKHLIAQAGDTADAQRAKIQDSDGQQMIPPKGGYASTQVQLVELLQFIRHRQPRGAALRIGIVVSAWDIVLDLQKTTPDAWLAKRLPLLHQYIVANSDIVPFRIYGVSAQGGDLAEADKLRKSYRPSDRIVVAHGSKTWHDITLPVRWVMDIPEA